MVLPTPSNISVTTEFLTSVFDLCGILVGESRGLEDVRTADPEGWFLSKNQIMWEALSSPRHLIDRAQELTRFVRSFFSVTKEEEERALYMPPVEGARDLFDMVRAVVLVDEQTELYARTFEMEMLRKRGLREQRLVKRSDVASDVLLSAESAADRQLKACYDSIQAAVEEFITVLEHIPRSTHRTERVAIAGPSAVEQSPILSQESAPEIDSETLMTRRANVLREVMDTEETYQRSLALFKKHYLSTLKDTLVLPQPLLDSAMIYDLCDAVDLILTISSSLLQSLRDEYQQRPPPDTCLAAIFRRFMPLFKLYMQYLRHYSVFQERLGHLSKQQRFSEWVDEAADAVRVSEGVASPLSLTSYLIMPVQRLPRYEMLLQTLLKAVPSSHPEHATLAITAAQLRAINQEINQDKRAQEDILKVRQVISEISQVPKIFSQTSIFLRAVDMEGRFHRNMSTRAVHLAMFSDVLVIAAPSSGQQPRFTFIESLNFSNVELKDLDDPPLSFELINLTTRLKWRLWAQNEEQKRSWLTYLAQSIQANAFRGMFANTLSAASRAIDRIANEHGQRLLCLTSRGLNTPSSWTKMWDNRSTGTPHNVSIFRPIPPRGFFIVGDYAEPDTNDPLPRSPLNVVAVREDPISYDPSLPPLLAAPLDYAQIWTDSGTGGDFGDVSIWLPVAPPDYVALGCVCGIHYGGRKPDTEAIHYRCVHKSVLCPSTYQPITSHTSGALWFYASTSILRKYKTAHVSLWQVGAHPSLDRTFPPGTFLASQNKDAPDKQLPVFCFLPAIMKQKEGGEEDDDPSFSSSRVAPSSSSSSSSSSLLPHTLASPAPPPPFPN